MGSIRLVALSIGDLCFWNWTHLYFFLKQTYFVLDSPCDLCHYAEHTRAWGGTSAKITHPRQVTTHNCEG